MSDGEKLSWVELSKRLGYSRRAVYTWREMEGAPSEPDLMAWTVFIEDNELGKRDTKSLTEIKVEVEAERLKKLRRENEVAERKIVSVEDMEAMLSNLAAKLDLLLTQKLETELPPKVLGEPIATIRAACRSVHDEIREATRRGLSSWSAPE